MTTTPLDDRTQALWATELASCNEWIPRIESEARSYAHAATTLPFDPELAQHYVELAAHTQERAQRVRARRQQIQDYLAGKIGQWW